MTLDTVADMQRDPLWGWAHAKVSGLGGDHPFFGFPQTGGYALQQRPDELAALFVLLSRLQIGDAFDGYLEIGSASGGTARAMVEFLRPKAALLLDDGTHPRASELEANVMAMACDVDVRIGDSHDPGAWEHARKWMREFTPKRVVAFIDGDHSFIGARMDVALVEDVCPPGTIVVMHDTIFHDAPRQVFHNTRCLTPVAEFNADPALGLGVAVLR